MSEDSSGTSSVIAPGDGFGDIIADVVRCVDAETARDRQLDKSVQRDVSVRIIDEASPNSVQPIKRVFRHGDWVRHISGLYKGDIALVRDRQLQGIRTPSVAEPNKISVLVVPRIRLPRPRPTGLKEKRPVARRVTRQMQQQAESFGDNCYEGLVFVNTLLVTTVESKWVVRSTPRYEELHDYSEAGLNVRAWRRFIAQSSLRFGERVLVRGGVEDGMVATFYSSVGTEAVVVPVQGETREISVSIHQLEREFRVHDAVRRVPTVFGEPVRIGKSLRSWKWARNRGRRERETNVL